MKGILGKVANKRTENRSKWLDGKRQTTYMTSDVQTVLGHRLLTVCKHLETADILRISSLNTQTLNFMMKEFYEHGWGVGVVLCIFLGIFYYCGVILFSKFSAKVLVLLMRSVYQPHQQKLRGIKLGK